MARERIQEGLGPIVGLTGGIGSGKSAVAERFAALGVRVVDTDRVAHALTAAGGAAMPAIVAAFGAGMAGADGSLDRAAMRERVFADPAARHRLEAILHPMILRQSLAELEGAPGPYAMLAVPLLFEAPLFAGVVARSLVVDCPEALQRERVMRRNGLSAEQVAAIMAAQMGREQRLALADDVIDNGGDLAALDLQVQAKHRYYLACFEGAPVTPSSPQYGPAV